MNQTNIGYDKTKDKNGNIYRRNYFCKGNTKSVGCGNLTNGMWYTVEGDQKILKIKDNGIWKLVFCTEGKKINIKERRKDRVLDTNRIEMYIGDNLKEGMEFIHYFVMKDLLQNGYPQELIDYECEFLGLDRISIPNHKCLKKPLLFNPTKPHVRIYNDYYHVVFPDIKETIKIIDREKNDLGNKVILDYVKKEKLKGISGGYIIIKSYQKINGECWYTILRKGKKERKACILKYLKTGVKCE